MSASPLSATPTEAAGPTPAPFETHSVDNQARVVSRVSLRQCTRQPHLAITTNC